MKGELFQGADLRRMPLSAGGGLGAGLWQVQAVWRWEAATKSPRSLRGAGLWCCWMQAEASCRFPWVPLGFHPVFFSLVNICCDAGPGWQQRFWSPSPCKRLSTQLGDLLQMRGGSGQPWLSCASCLGSRCSLQSAAAACCEPPQEEIPPGAPL